MTKKDFIALARIVDEAMEEGFFNSAAEGMVFANKLADYCATKNPRFNRPVFLEACGVGGYDVD